MNFTLDPVTLLFATVLVVLFSSATYVATWVQNRHETALLWMAAASILGCAGLTLRGILPFVPAIASGNVAILTAFALIWTGFRDLAGKRPLALAILLPALIWLACCATPLFRADLALRIVVGCSIGLLYVGLALRELLGLRKGGGIAHWWLIGVLVVQLAIVADRTIYSILFPRHRNMVYLSIFGLPVLMIDWLVFMLLLSFSMILLIRERSDRQYQTAARLDTMTGIGNRRCFEENLADHFQRSADLAQPLALIMIDADEFKSYNDRFGHPAGDECLRQLAAAITAATKPDALVARYGGEEFAVLLPGIDCDTALPIAEAIRNSVRDLAMAHPGRPGGIVTISLGVASLVPRTGENDPRDLVNTADRALYAAKRTGRDRTIKYQAA